MAGQHTDCLFCKIVQGSIPAKVLAQNEDALVFEDINPQAPVHLLGIPKRHITSLNEVQSADWPQVNATMELLQTIAREKGLDKEGYRLVNNMGTNGGQTVFHLHFHVLGGRRMAWPPG